MSREAGYSPKPVGEIRTLGQYLDAGLVVRSFCSSGHDHSHIVDLERLAKELGPDVEVDYDFKVSRICPECGAPGGGLDVRLQI